MTVGAGLSLSDDETEQRPQNSVIRQLIECEYLLTLFNNDLEHARRWRESTPDEVRRSFAPQTMRKLTGFADQEYWDHCSTGGHPAPKGARLLEKLDPARQSWPYSAAELLIDLGLHLRRIWKALDALLMKHHARYGRVRASQRRQAEEAWSRWLEADPVAGALIEAWSGSLPKLQVPGPAARRPARPRPPPAGCSQRRRSRKRRVRRPAHGCPLGDPLTDTSLAASLAGPFVPLLHIPRYRARVTRPGTAGKLVPKAGCLSPHPPVCTRCGARCRRPLMPS